MLRLPIPRYQVRIPYSAKLLQNFQQPPLKEPTYNICEDSAEITEIGAVMPCLDLPSPSPSFQPMACISLLPTFFLPIGCFSGAADCEIEAADDVAFSCSLRGGADMPCFSLLSFALSLYWSIEARESSLPNKASDCCWELLPVLGSRFFICSSMLD